MRRCTSILPPRAISPSPFFFLNHRSNEYRRLDAFVQGQGGKLALAYGLGGSGKTSLLSAWAERYKVPQSSQTQMCKHSCREAKMWYLFTWLAQATLATCTPTSWQDSHASSMNNFGSPSTKMMVQSSFLMSQKLLHARRRKCRRPVQDRTRSCLCQVMTCTGTEGKKCHA